MADFLSECDDANGPPDFWPDIDVYFKRDTDLARRLIDRLAAAGVRTLKAAALHDPNCCLAANGVAAYFVPGSGMISEPYRAVIDRHVVALDQLRLILAHARQHRLRLVLSVYDFAGIELASEFAVEAIKIPSSNIVHAPLIRKAAASTLPLVLDTGRSRLGEIDRAVEWARAAGASRILIQHSPPGPPAQAENFRLAMLPEMGRRYGLAYGLSDHHTDLDMFPLAVALGASVIEKGVCADGTDSDIDIAHALPISQVPRALALIAAAHSSIGSADLGYRADLEPPSDRMGLIAARDLELGEVLDAASTGFAFPALGIPVEDWDRVIGSRLRRRVPEGHAITAEHIDPYD